MKYLDMAHWNWNTVPHQHFFRLFSHDQISKISTNEVLKLNSLMMTCHFFPYFNIPCVFMSCSLLPCPPPVYSQSTHSFHAAVIL